MIGLLLWQAFVDAVQSPLKTVTAAKSMLTRINFPREAVLLAGLGEVLFNFLVRLVLLIAVFLWFKLVPPATIWLAPLGVAAIVALGFMIGVLLTPLGVLYSDVAQGLPVITTFWMFLTPVVYPPPQVGLGALLSHWNPVSPLIIVTRDWMTLGTTTQLAGFVLIFSATLVALFLGWMAYRMAMPHLIARIGS
jgi:lipopolysaccharide transport system permease protein